eukprot:CAMPEP_0177649204 /NCGR_PEP_ID=MMETSP0447-20121125/11248_1 /TAXON_ID=0 /ORGANISM="Stygamoeba regulata, Strain BSH-02190019" /LENGTH=171 /DNA_ID=CAMNT_0019151919 /DNA_START=68 /DNA_END=583 /DNA_ORIENTATION=-
MKVFVALLLLSCLFAGALAQIRLEEVKGTRNADGDKIPAYDVKGRGFASGDAFTAPCGQGTNGPFGERVYVKNDRNYMFVFTVIDALGGGVISAYYGQGSNPDPLDITFPYFMGAYGQIQDYGQAKTYEIKVKTPKFNNEITFGDGTIQLVYTGNDGRNAFQCVDVYLTSN